MRSTDEPAAPRDLGPYRLLGVVRRDDRLALCQAEDRRDGARRLVTVLLPGRVPGSLARRFVRQARSLSTLHSPGLPPVLDSGLLPSGAAFVVTGLSPGVPADEWLRRVRTVGSRPALAAALVAAVAESCARLAGVGVVHGDVRLANLRLLPVDAEPERFAVRLIGGELAALRGAPDTRSDVHALGCLFLELLVGVPPSAAGEGAALDALPPTISIEMRRLIGRMLSKLPASRHQRMDEVVTAIELLLGRHRTRLSELLTDPDARALASELGPPRMSEDLAAVAPALTGDAVEHWMAAASIAIRRLATAAREATIRKLMSLRPRPEALAEGVPTVLVAEDDDDTRQSLVELLEEHGYRVIAARHGLEAQDYLRRGHPAQCMLMDLWMPEMDGWTLAAEMQGGRLPAVPTIVMTAAEPHWGYPGPVVVRKPFDTHHLLSLVKAVSDPERTYIHDKGVGEVAVAVPRERGES